MAAALVVLSGVVALLVANLTLALLAARPFRKPMRLRSSAAPLRDPVLVGAGRGWRKRYAGMRPRVECVSRAACSA